MHFSLVCTCSRILTMKVYRQFKDEGRKVKRLEVPEIPQDSAKYEHMLKYQKKKKVYFQNTICQVFRGRFPKVGTQLPQNTYA